MEQTAIAPGVPGAATGQVLERYGRHLAEERGLLPATVEFYVRDAGRFLAARPVGEALAGLKLGDVIGFVLVDSERFSVSTTKNTVTHLRSLLRFLHREGLCPPLAESIPGVAGWRNAGLPRGISIAEVARLLEAAGRSTMGLRDRALLLLLARLGLRRVEVTRLELDDLDWRRGELVVRGKGDSTERLPMPYEVGEAVARYITETRPTTPSRRVFLSAAGRELTSSGVGRMVRKACVRGGVAPLGAHRLRHTLATQTLAAGGSLAEVAQVLRHRHLATTAIYAKVDRNALRAVARPWPGALS